MHQFHQKRQPRQMHLKLLRESTVFTQLFHKNYLKNRQNNNDTQDDGDAEDLQEAAEAASAPSSHGI
jgi:hypothetical protein